MTQIMQTDREKEILHWRFVIGLPAGGVGQLFSVTRERIRQIQTKAVSKLVRYCDITFIVSPKISFTRRESKESNKQFAGESKFNKNLFRRVDELGLSARQAQCLKGLNVIYIAELVARDERQLLGTPNFGRKSLNQIKEMLAPLGLRLGMDLSDWASSGEPLLESIELRNRMFEISVYGC
jgi:DNA-directed RNA polymerase alpha subunit